MPGSLCAGNHDAGMRKPGPEWGGLAGALFPARFSQDAGAETHPLPFTRPGTGPAELRVP